MNRSWLIAAIRAPHNLNDSAESTWTAANLNNIFDDVLVEITEKRALKKSAILPLTQYTKSVDISSLSRLVKLYNVEYPVGNANLTPVYRGFARHDTYIDLDLNYIPTIYYRSSGGQTEGTGTLTGTLTFTKGSRAVTGSGTDFETELHSNVDHTYGDLVCVSSGSRYYQVAHITDDTNLTLDEPFEEETVTDTEDATLHRTYKGAAKVHYGKEYTCTRSKVNFIGSGLNDLTVGVNFSGTSEKHYRVKINSAGTPDTYKYSTDGGTTWSDAANCSASETVIGSLLSITFGATTGHTANDYWEWYAKPSDVPPEVENVLIKGVVANAALQYASFLTDAETALDRVYGTYQDTGDNLINAINVGGSNAPMLYAQYAQISMEEAKGRISKAKEYRAWGALKYQEYQRDLSKLYRFSDHIKRNYPRGE